MYYEQLIRLPGVLQFELQHRVSSTGRLIHHTKTGFDPPSAEVQTSTEGEFEAFSLQATTHGWIGFYSY